MYAAYGLGVVSRPFDGQKETHTCMYMLISIHINMLISLYMCICVGGLCNVF